MRVLQVRSVALVLGLAATASAQSTLATYEGGAFDHLSISIGGRDLNSDGFDDFLLATPHDGQDAGVVTAYSGADGATLWTSQGADGDEFGHALAWIADMTNDGVADVVVGSPGAEIAPGSPRGSVVILSGAHGGVFLERFGAGDGDGMGHSVASGFDYDRDGIEDFAGGAPQALGTGGQVHTWSGANGTFLDTWTEYQAGANLGWAVAGVGDVDQDGFGDLCIGAPGLDSGTIPKAGWFSVVSDHSTLLSQSGCVASGQLGSAIAPADDFDNDGHPDFLVGAVGEAGAHGQVILFSGETGWFLWSWSGDALLDYFGFSLARVGDVDGDGKQDFAVGAPQPQGTGPGYSRVISLKFGAELYTVTGAAVDHEFGSHVGALGDVNQDGMPDMGVGAPGWDDPAFIFALDGGQVTFFSGGCPGFVNYCTAGTSSSGCQAQVSGSGGPELVRAVGLHGGRDRCRRGQERALLHRLERPSGEPLGQRHQLPVRGAAGQAHGGVAEGRDARPLRRIVRAGPERVLEREPEQEPRTGCSGAGTALVPGPWQHLEPVDIALERARVRGLQLTRGRGLGWRDGSRPRVGASRAGGRGVLGPGASRLVDRRGRAEQPL